MDNSFLHTKRLLLVDDEQELLKMVSDILKDAGFETVAEESAHAVAEVITPIASRRSHPAQVKLPI